MRILFLSHYFPPEVNAPASRTYEHCRAWVESGHEVTVLTCFPNHPKGQIFEGYRNRLSQRDDRDGIAVIRLFTYATPNSGFFRRTLNHIVFMVIAIAASAFVRRHDVVVTTSPQFFNGLAGYLVKFIHRAPWVLEIRDLWPESITAVGALSNRTAIRFLGWLEEFAYRKADRIVVVTDAFKRHIVGRGIAPAKVIPVKNGVDLGFFSPRERDERLAETLGLSGKFVVTYAGTIGMAHGLETVLEVAEWLRDKPNIRLLVIGEGADKARFCKLREEGKFENVVVLDQQPKSMMPTIWTLTDVGLVMLRPLPMFKSVLPSKMFEIMAMSRPIILSVDGESREVLEDAKAGIAVHPGDAKAIATSILGLIDNSARARAYGVSGRNYVAIHHDRRQLAHRFESLLMDLVPTKRTESAFGSKHVEF